MRNLATPEISKNSPDPTLVSEADEAFCALFTISVSK